MGEHGGNIDEAWRHFGGKPEAWLDLSTGINRRAYPVAHASLSSLKMLPTRRQIKDLCQAASHNYGTDTPIAPLHGVQSAIQFLPYILPKTKLHYLWPSYNEYPKMFKLSGWSCHPARTLQDLKGADLAILVNPNNPTGQCWSPDELLALSKTTQLLLIDESFIEASSTPSLAPFLPRYENIILLRSFGKFYGLAGLRLGFMLGAQKWIDQVTTQHGSWPVSSLACVMGRQALCDTGWQDKTRAYLMHAAQTLDDLAHKAGLTCLGGTWLFRLYETDEARHVQTHLAQSHIWSRIFSYNPHWLRLGVPGYPRDWTRLKAALKTLSC